MQECGQKLLVAVLMGGPSSEHEVSLKTGAEILKYLDRRKYRIRPIVISKKNKWFLGNKCLSPGEALKGADVAFNAMHGEYGEDGRAQSLLEFYGVPYTGSGVAASAMGMDKAVSRKIFKAHGLATPKTLHLTRKEYKKNKKASRYKIFKTHGSGPWVIKPASCGSSVGVSIVENPRDIDRALNTAFRFAESVLVEEYLRGRELTVPVLERKRGRAEALPIIEIRPRKGKFFDYKEKYSDDGAEEIVPAPLPKAVAQKVARAALVAHQALGCKGYSRVDCILVKNTPYILELNTLPGLTSASLFPKSARVAGISFYKLLDIIIYECLCRKSRH